MEGLEFLGIIEPRDIDDFKLKKVYRFAPDSENGPATIIELELFDSNVCLLSFYQEGAGTGRDRYKQRANVGTGHARSILKACLEAYYQLDGDYALMFSAANDPERVQETNGRFSLYKLFLNHYFKDIEKHEYRECSVLNTLILYQPDLPKKDEALDFYLGFEKRVKANIENEVNDDYNPLPRLPKEFFDGVMQEGKAFEK